mmetsp:Transcript_63321/g.176141  ORF Transcript_63321/g.176141 Transcript_63321/m.176141 type:complete len:201 (-) Transcript_63321:41-643(-)
MGQELLPPKGWERGAVHDVVVDVNVLDREVSEDHAEGDRDRPVEFPEVAQRHGIPDDERPLRYVNEGEHIPHVHHLLGGDAREKEGQFSRHGVRFVRRWEKAARLFAPVPVVLLDGHHLVFALFRALCIRVALVGGKVFHVRDLVINRIPLLQFVQILVGTIEDGGFGVPAPFSRGLRQEWLRHRVHGNTRLRHKNNAPR